MGLSVYSYRDCRLANPQPDRQYGVTGAVKPYVNPDFPIRADDILHDHWYYYSETMNFGAGPYHWYGEWRAKLAQVGGYKNHDAWDGRVINAPFIELVNFADNEGVIGAKTSEKLAADFEAYETEAAKFMDADEMQVYRKFRKAFEMAAKNGLVNFR